MLANKNLEVKPLDQIISDLMDERNPTRIIKSYFRPSKYYISKRLLIDFRRDLALENSVFKINSIYERLVYLIDIRIPLELKINTFISYLYNSSNDFLNNESRLYSFLTLFTKTFNADTLKIHKSLDSLKFCLIDLLEIVKEKIKKKHSLIFIRYYLSLVEIYFNLLKLGFVSNDDFWKEFEVFENIPKIYYPLKLFQLKILYFKEVLEDNDKVKKVIFEFLKLYPKDLMKELNTRHYPNPIKFCIFLENNLKSQIFEIYLEYYMGYTTNFIPPLLLKHNKLNDSTVLKIIVKNLNSTLFDYYDIKDLYETLSKHRPNKNVFGLYCEVIISFKRQMFPFVIIDVFKLKSLSLKQKFKIVAQFYSKYPETKWDSFQPSFQSFLKNLNNKGILRLYFSVIIKSENYKDFHSFYKNLFIYNTKKLKEFGVVNYKKKKLKGIMEIINTPKFNMLKLLLKIFKSNFYNIYDDYLSIEDFVLKNFSFKSEKLILFFFKYFSEVARHENDSKFILNLYDEYDLFVRDLKREPGQILTLYSSKNLGVFQLKGEKIISLISLGEKENLIKFINRNIANETKNENPDYRLLAFFEFLKGKYQISKQYLEKEVNILESYSKPMSFIDRNEDKLDFQEQIQENQILSQIILYELNLNERGSMTEVLKELMIIIKRLDPKKILFIYGHFNSYHLFHHYFNLYYFFQVINSFHKKEYETGKSYLNQIIKTPICKQWEDLYDLWEEILPHSDIVHRIKDFSKRQYEIFESNPIFTSTKVFLRNLFRKGSNLSQIFNYKDLLKEKYSDLSLQRIFWREVREFVKKIDRNLIFEVGDSELEIQNNLKKLLSSRFELVEAPKRSNISYKHIDILINNIIPIEIKRLDNTSKIDHGWGQVEVDFNIWNLNFGIELCIVEDYKKLQKQFLLREFIIGNTENICIIIK